MAGKTEKNSPEIPANAATSPTIRRNSDLRFICARVVKSRVGMVICWIGFGLLTWRMSGDVRWAVLSGLCLLLTIVETVSRCAQVYLMTNLVDALEWHRWEQVLTYLDPFRRMRYVI